jgi:hypothetical protein
MRRLFEFMCIGIGAGLWLAGAMTAGGDPDGAAQLILASVPVVGLLAVAIFYGARRQWPVRVASAGLGGALACVVALVLVRLFAASTSSLVWSGGRVDVMLLAGFVLTAVIPGVIAAANVSFRRGLALSGGFTGTLALLLTVGYNVNVCAPAPWELIALLLAGTVTGAFTGWLIGRGD